MKTAATKTGNLPGTISAATAEDAGRFMDALFATRQAQDLSAKLRCPCGQAATTMLAGVVAVCPKCAHDDRAFGIRPKRATLSSRRAKPRRAK